MDKIEVLVHRESVIHSLVEYIDGAQIAQISDPDMRMCIRYALSYPARAKTSARPTNLWERGKLTFFPPDEETFKPLRLARYAMNGGGLLPAVFHGANDAAVDLFLQNRIKFLEIADLTEEVLHKYKNTPHPTLEALLAADADAAEQVRVLAL
jgi:1-deoxy-D-xylulose-5-phosphate reductoisomerase